MTFQTPNGNTTQTSRPTQGHSSTQGAVFGTLWSRHAAVPPTRRVQYHTSHNAHAENCAPPPQQPGEIDRPPPHPRGQSTSHLPHPPGQSTASQETVNRPPLSLTQPHPPHKQIRRAAWHAPARARLSPQPRLPAAASTAPSDVQRKSLLVRRSGRHRRLHRRCLRRAEALRTLEAVYQADVVPPTKH